MKLNKLFPQNWFDIDVDDERESYLLSKWLTPTSQQMNFIAVSKMLDREKIKDLLDVGCGMGDLSKFIPKGIEYNGIDMFKNVIKVAQKRNPKLSFNVADIFSYSNNRMFDAIVSNGAFNLGYDVDKVLEALNIMYKLAKKLVVVTMSYASTDDIIKFTNAGYNILNMNSNYGGNGDDIILIKEK